MSNPPKLCLVFRQLGYVFPRGSSQALPWARFSSLYLLFQPPLLQVILPQRQICWRSTHQKLGFLETGEGRPFIHSLTHLTEGQSSGGFPGGSVVKNLPANTGDAGYAGSVPGSWRRKWQPAPVFLPGKFHGQRSLAGYSPPGCKESDTTE